MSNQQQISQERYDIMMGRYQKYLDNLNDPNTEPVKVFDPLTPKQLEELQMIREVSRQLQGKKEEDVRKAAQDKEETKTTADEKKKEPDGEEPVEESKKEE